MRTNKNLEFNYTSCSLGDFLANQRIRLFLKVANYFGYFCYEIYFEWVTKKRPKSRTSRPRPVALVPNVFKTVQNFVSDNNHVGLFQELSRTCQKSPTQIFENFWRLNEAWKITTPVLFDCYLIFIAVSCDFIYPKKKFLARILVC